MRSSVDDMAELPLVEDDGGIERWQYEAPYEVVRGFLVGQVDELRRREEVRDDDAGQPLGQARRLLTADVRSEHRREEQRGSSEDTGQAFDGELAGHFAGLGRQHQLERLVGLEH